MLQGKWRVRKSHARCLFEPLTKHRHFGYSAMTGAMTSGSFFYAAVDVRAELKISFRVAYDKLFNVPNHMGERDFNSPKRMG